MKKTLLTILALALAFSLAACGGGKTDSPTASTSPPATGGSAPSTKPTESAVTAPDLNSVIGGSTKLSDADPASQQAMIDEARRQGGDMEFRSDGSVVFTDPDGNVVVQNPDGSWSYQDEDGGSVSMQMGGNWPDNEFTQMLPKPDFTITSAVDADGVFNVMFSGVTIEQLKDYTEKVKAAGFSFDEETEDMEVQGTVVYTYTAKNADDCEVTVFFTSGASGITLSK